MDEWHRQKHGIETDGGRVPNIKEVPDDAVGREVHDVIEKNGREKVQTVGKQGTLCEMMCTFMRVDDHEVCANCESVLFNARPLKVGENDE